MEDGYEVSAGIKDVREYKENFLPAAEKEGWFKLTGGQLPEGLFWKKNGFYDPAAALQSIRCPLLVIYAEFDISTNTANNLPLMKSLLQTPEVKYAVFKANHWMMEVDSKGFAKKQLPFITRFADGYLETLVRWTQSAVTK